MTSDSQGCKVETNFSLLAYIDGVKCFEDVAPAILTREAELKRVQAEADAAADDITFLKKSNEENRLRYQLQILEQVRIRELIDRQGQSIVNLVDKVQAKLSARLDKFEQDVSKIKQQIEGFEETSEEAKEIAGSFDRLLADTNKCLDEVIETVQRGDQCFQQLTKRVDQIDNRSRAKNVVIHGLRANNIKKAVTSILAEHPSLIKQFDTAYYLGNGLPGVSRPALVQFTTVAGRDFFLQYSRHEDFSNFHRHLVVVPDESELKRQGTNRLAAVSPALKLQFPNILIRHGYAKLDNLKYSAVDFTFTEIAISGILFNIDDALQQIENKRLSSNERVPSAGERRGSRSHLVTAHKTSTHQANDVSSSFFYARRETVETNPSQRAVFKQKPESSYKSTRLPRHACVQSDARKRL